MASSHNAVHVALALSIMLTSSAPALATIPAGVTKASCSVASVPPTLRERFPAEMPLISKLQGASGTAKVRVTLSNDGTLKNATIVESSGNDQLDAAGIQTARAQHYAPELRDCKVIDGTYVLSVDFLA